VTTLAAWVPGLPLLGALFGLALGGRFPALVRPLAMVPTAAATVLALLVAVEHGAGGPAQSGRALTPTGSVDIVLGVRVDGLAAVVAPMVCVIALLVQVYSAGYLRGERRYSSYAALVSLFTAAMLLVVYSADLIVLLVGWEVMGICSYFLIGHYWELPEARAASIKAFLVTKLGDVPFLFGIFALGYDAHSFRIADVLATLGHGGPHTTLATLLLLGGVAGKSAQFPLHTWLPDAMVGPTPISALIHAATMVAAGVYVVARLFPVFLAAPVTMTVLAALAAITMVGAACVAFTQDDIKRVLAYSTVSQLGYMTGGLAAGGRDAAVFHLLSHAAFKALLFLAAGVVIHTVGTNSMSRMGGLRTRLPVTFWTMSAGLAALAGVPPFSGFLSKDAVLGAAQESALHPSAGGGPVAAGLLVLVAGLITVFLTGAYATRLWLRTFFGANRGAAPVALPAAGGAPAVAATVPTDPEAQADQERGRGHPMSAGSEAGAAREAIVAAAEARVDRRRAVPEAPASMLWPLLLLAVPTVLFGALVFGGSALPTWLGGPDGAPLDYHASGQPRPYLTLTPVGWTALCSLLLAVAGFLLVYRAWRRDPAADPAVALGRARGAVERGFGVDACYDALIVRPCWAAARLVRFLDFAVVDAYVRGAGVATRWLGGALRRVQNGNTQTYLTGLIAGVVLILVAVVTSVGGR
jgi:NADH-quinone oxidoreductase subunit L